MDLKAILKARNLSDEQIETLTTKPEYSTLLETFVKEAEDGKTAYQKAQEVEQNLKTWNETQVVPYVRGADEKVAAMSAKLAATQAHMKALKDAGYDIPESYFEAAPAAAVKETPAAFDPKMMDDRAKDIAFTNMALVSLSNKHAKLTGEYLDLENEYQDFEKNKRPQENLRSYVARKYDHDGLSQKVAAAAEQKKLDEYAASKVQEEKAKWVQSNGTNPETRIPRSSRFDAITKEPERAKLWQTAAGREKATQERLAKYTNLVQ
jgi:hypothetical protein